MIVEFINSSKSRGCHRHAILQHDHPSSNKDKMTENAKPRSEERANSNKHIEIPTPTQVEPASRRSTQDRAKRNVGHALKPPLADLPSSTPASPDLQPWPVLHAHQSHHMLSSGKPALVPTSGAKSFPARRVEPRRAEATAEDSGCAEPLQHRVWNTTPYTPSCPSQALP